MTSIPVFATRVCIIVCISTILYCFTFAIAPVLWLVKKKKKHTQNDCIEVYKDVYSILSLLEFRLYYCRHLVKNNRNDQKCSQNIKISPFQKWKNCQNIPDIINIFIGVRNFRVFSVLIYFIPSTCIQHLQLPTHNRSPTMV